MQILWQDLRFGLGGCDIFRLVMREGVGLTLIGLALGVAGALGAARFIAGGLYSAGAADPVASALVAALPAGVALVACYVPAWRETKVDPTEALRYEEPFFSLPADAARA
jgi:putative ABC transport system permease protein